jgi:hypothetical protein
VKRVSYAVIVLGALRGVVSVALCK